LGKWALNGGGIGYIIGDRGLISGTLGSRNMLQGVKGGGTG